MKVVGHSFRRDVRDVMRYSSCLNMDYPDKESFLVCECGWETPLRKSEKDVETRCMELEHVVESLLG